MVKARTWLALGLMSMGTLAATVGCGSDETTGPGGGLIGAGAGGTSAGGTGAVGRGGSSSGGSSGSGAVASSLGLKCQSDADCGTGLTCLLATGTDLGSGGPANGVCSLACTADSDCQTAEAGAGCVFVNDTSGFCFEACTAGDPLDVNSKCQGRQDFACLDLSQTGDGSETFCVPYCQADAQCSGGEFCNDQTGLCEKTKPMGAVTGTACDPSATTDPCLGFCFGTDQNDPTKGACADLCSAQTECNFTGTKAGGICVGLTQSAGLFDPGICENSCNCDSECPFPGDVCVAWDATATKLMSDLGTKGFCFPNATGATELTTCTTGGAGGASGASGAGGTGGSAAGGGGVGGTAGAGAAGGGSGSAAAGTGGAAAGTGGTGGAIGGTGGTGGATP